MRIKLNKKIVKINIRKVEGNIILSNRRDRSLNLILFATIYNISSLQMDAFPDLMFFFGAERSDVL